jgi:5-(carboxyamino)imidazole ribonucleotide synthase
VTLVACIGGGQLGRMLGLAGIPLGLRFRFLDPSADAPAVEVGELVVGDYDDPRALAQLADGAEVVTYEFENVPVDAARSVGTLPPPRALELGQDRLTEKRLLTRLGIATARYGATADTGLPALVKSRRLGYDGKGQRLVHEHEPLGEGELAEELVAFERELSIVAVRGRDGETRFWPLTENVHRDGILRLSRAPAPDAPDRAAEELVTRLLDDLGYVGVIALELFEAGGRLLANEFAPRVHNTGHWTIDGAETSQFENHLRAILGLPLGSTAARAPAVMINLVGGIPDPAALLALPGAHLHLYGKQPRPGRKLGHVTLVGASDAAVAEAVRLADAAVRP